LSVAEASASPPPFGALEEAGSDEAEYQRAADHQGRLAPSQILQVLPHGASILAPEVLGHLLYLACDSVGQPGNSLLILGTEVFGGTPQRIRDRAELFGKLAFAFPQAGGSPLAGLLERVLGLVNHLVFNTPDLFPGAATGLLAGDLGSGARGFGVRHRHRVAPLADIRQYPTSRQCSAGLIDH
jgi:hypothetical protein